VNQKSTVGNDKDIAEKEVEVALLTSQGTGSQCVTEAETTSPATGCFSITVPRLEVGKTSGAPMLKGQSFDSEATITEYDGSVLSVVVADNSMDNDSSMEDSEEEEVSIVLKIHSGRVQKVGEDKRCMIRLTYEDSPAETRWEEVPAAILDDPDHKIMLWVIKNKSSEPIWRDQITKAIVGSLSDKVTFLRGGWIGRLL